ncbi:MAG: hypothetical protein LW859_41050 [Anabaena sp. 49633_E8]|nr:hypothetical protein [Anabaena sp. 49633_E8]
MYYYPLQPPYFLLLVGFLTAFTSGLALSGTLKVIVQQWPQDKSPKEKTNTRSFYKQLLVPFIGITGGSCLFLCSGFEIFGFPLGMALSIGLPMTLVKGRELDFYCFPPLQGGTKGGSNVMKITEYHFSNIL